MSSKKYRAVPHQFEILDKHKYLCWFDTKLKIFENVVLKNIEILEKNDDKTLVLTKHPYSNKFTSVWDEYNLCIGVPKYGAQKDQYKRFIEKKIHEGFSEKINIHFCGGFMIKKKSEITKKFGEDWYNNILECGIEDQIALQFVQQKFIHHIVPLEYQESWKYFYE